MIIGLHLIFSNNEPPLISVTVGFFDAIFIKAANMGEGMYYNETEKIWVWDYDEENKLFLDVGE